MIESNYKILNVDGWPKMQEELANYTAPFLQSTSTQRFWDLPGIHLFFHCPTFAAFIRQRTIKPIRYLRLYRTMPHTVVEPHYGPSTEAAINFPIVGYKNSFMNWYSNPQDNVEPDGNVVDGFKQLRIIDMQRLKMIDTLVLDKPTIVKTDGVTDVQHHSESQRLILRVGFVDDVLMSELDEVFDFSGIIDKTGI